jgi:hypothetical protein
MYCGVVGRRFWPKQYCRRFSPELHLSSNFWPRTNHGTGFNRSLPQNASSSLLPDGATGILEAEWGEEVEERNTIFVGNVNEKEKKA